MRALASLLLAFGLLWSSMASAVGDPSTYPGCATRNVNVAWGGSVNVDLSACHFFGLGVVSTPPTHGTATEGDPEPIDSYNYNHNGSTPAGGGSDQFVVLDDNSDFITVNVTISAPTSAIVVSPATLPAMTAGTPFSQTLTSNGGGVPYAYSLVSGTLPVGISLSAGGTLSGTPTQRGGFGFSVRSQDSNGDFAVKAYGDAVNNPTLSIPASATAIQGVAFSQALAVTGGVAPHSFLLESGTFPAGISISSAGVVSGTTAAAPGAFPVTLRVTDASTGPGSYFELESFTLNVSAAPSVSIAVAPASVSEDGATNLVYTLTRSASLASPTVVNITTTGTATSGTDYAGGVATVSIPAGATTATITIDPTVDATVEADETVILTVAAGAGYTVGAPAGATGTILNDDVPTASIAVAPASVSEDGVPNLVYTVTLNQAALTPTSVNFTVAGTATSGTDYAAVTSPLVIPAGNTTGTITVNPTTDATNEADETVILTLAAGAGYTVGVPAGATGTILNDDLPTLSINDVALNEGNAGTSNATFTVSLSAPAGPGGVTFDIATANGTATTGTDFTGSSLTGQTIPAGSSTYTFTVLINGDTLNESNETFFVNVTNVTGATVSDGQGLGTITNDDALPSLAINDISVAEGNAGTVNAVFTVTLSAASGQVVGVSFATANGTAVAPGDYTSASGTLSFTPGQVTQTITVLVNGDIAPEADETFNVDLSAATNATISDNQGTGTILNDDVPVTVNPATVPDGTVAAAYSQTLTASGGLAPYSFAVTAGALPAGLTLSAGGTLSGTPTAGGSFNFTATATDSSPVPGPFSGSRAYTLTVAPATVSLPATPLAGGTLSTPYSASITAASGGTSPYAYAVTAGALPGGLTLNAATGAITGTPGALGTFNFSVTATDSSTGTGPYTATQAYSIVVIDNPPVANSGTLTVAYNAPATAVTLNITGGTPTSVAIATAASNGSAIATGTSITYQPTVGFAGSDSFTYTATNTGGTSAPATITVTVNDPVITITAGGALTATVAAPYSNTFTFNGGATPWSGFQVTNLPAGLSITATTANTVTVSGTPTQAGSFNLNVSATDSSTGSGPFTVGQAFTLAVAGPSLTLAPVAGTFSAPYGVAYSQAFTASGGTGPYTYSVSGALPAGLALGGNTISGTPTAPGSFPITITATDTGSTGTGSPFTVAQSYTIDVPAPTIVVTPATLPNPVAGAPYSQVVSASGGIAPYSFAVTAGSLPNGLALSAGGTISGTATQVGTFNLTVTGTDANGQAGALSYTLVVAAPVLTLSPPNGTLTATYGAAYSQAFTAGGSPGPYTYVLSGALPTGVSFSGNTLAGTPTVPGSYPITVTATDNGLTGAGAPFSITGSYTLNVPAPTVVLAPTTLADGIAGQAYAAALSASGGIAPYTFAVTAGALPNGLSLTAAGGLSGTPTQSGTFNFTVTATDANGQAGARAYAVAIAVPVLTLTPATLPSGIVGVGYSQSLSAAGGIAPYTYAVTAGALPAGLTLAGNGLLSGTPTAQGTFNATITATDSTAGTAATVSQAYAITIVFAPPVAANDTATVLAGQAVTIAVTSNDVSVAPITSIAIATPPAQGTAVVSGLDVIYTAPATAPPTVTFTYIASGPGGSSAPATVTVTVNPRAVAANLVATTPPATPVQVNLTSGAAGGPFTGAAVVSVSPAGSGTTAIAASGGNYVLTFTPDSAFSGVSVVSYTLSNAFTTSAPATVTITVQPRPDPTLDVELRGLIDAQVDSTKRFATTQINNFQQRLEQLHNGGEGGFDNRLGFAIDRPCIEPLVGYSIDPCNPDTNGFRGGNGLSSSATGSGAAGGQGNGGPVGTWIGGMIRSGSQDGRNGGADIDFETDGLSTGIDYRISSEWVIGGGFGFGKDENAIGTEGSRVDGDARTVALYASYHPGRMFVDMLLGYQSIDFDLRRYLTANGGTVDGQRDGNQLFASLSVGADIVRENMMFTPYARLDLAQADLDAYTETGDPIYALSYDQMDVDTATGNVGLRMDWQHDQPWGRFTPQVRLEYQHDFSGRSDALVRYADLLGGPVYGLSATGFDNNRFMVGLGALFDLNSGWGWRLEYRGQLSSGETDNGISVSVQKQF
ncbi:MAG: autotransporter outer membrane beta-barrel domain-containing protein [Lysobacteraceae bacterium]|nr:MAG: autotransporter outer membrane beta-barrel domain-containing protein [Xanthomonadaceae bacterium]